MLQRTICVVPQLKGVGGMVSFRARFTRELERRGFTVHHDLSRPAAAVLIIGGTRNLVGLWQAKRRGTRLVQRLDGMNWLHRKLATGWRHYLRSEYGNFILRTIRARMAHHVVYQSEFSRRWWEQSQGITSVTASVVYNGVNLETFSPGGEGERPSGGWRILMVEGSLMGGYEQGLFVARQLMEDLAVRLPEQPGELAVVGKVPQEIRQRLETHQTLNSNFQIRWIGQVPSERIPEIDRSAHLLYSSDVNAACPNAVIEALACGLPVLAYDTGALPEMVIGDAGRVVPYGGNPWNLEAPDTAALAAAATEILKDQTRFRREARARAEAIFSLDLMVSGYLDSLLG